jgi:hypothetical protein
MNRNNQVNMVVLECLDKDDRIVDVVEIPYEDFYEEDQPLIDSDELRKEKGIRKIKGVIFEDGGKIQSEFENRYDDSGAFLDD